ncbi:hypothetical protein Tco_0478075 [Tanacetum coccineum]
MEAPVISISSDVLVESVGSSFSRVILIGSIFVKVPVAPKVGAAAIASPTGVLELDTHSSSEVEPSESSPPSVSVAPMVLPFLCSDDLELDTEMPERHFPLALVDAPLEIRRRRAILIRPGEDIPIGQLYRTHPGTSHHLDHFTSGSSSGHSYSDHSLSGHSISGHSLSGHASPDTTIGDSSTPLRFGYPPLARTPWCSEAYLHWRSVPLSTMYLSTTSESSVGDSSFDLFARPSRKRCRSPAVTMTSFIHAMRVLVPSYVDLLPPRKRLRDSISPKDSVDEDIDTDVLADFEADATANEVAVDRDVEAVVDAGIGMEVDVGVDVEDEVDSSDTGTMEVGVDVVVGIDIPDGMLMPDAVEHLEQVEEGLQDIYEHNMTNTRSGMTPEAIKELINQRVEEALAAYEATRAANALKAESQSQNGSDGDNGNGRDRNGRDGNSGDGNGENGNGGNGNPNENNMGVRPVARECTYQDFMK